jgi:type I restriction enzyme M protein
MTKNDQKQLGKILWNIADQLRGAMNADDFRDYMLAIDVHAGSTLTS